MSEKILVVEDNVAMRSSLVRLLKSELYQVAEAADGEAGLAEYARFVPDLVIMDLSLPGIHPAPWLAHTLQSFEHWLSLTSVFEFDLQHPLGGVAFQHLKTFYEPFILKYFSYGKLSL